MAEWNTSDSGILRKNTTSENYDDLLVFGYACKLFREDEKALYIDQGKHLIPWMGDETLKIDRYDCRGALSDLRKYEASREGFDALRWLGLSEKEKQLEELCDKERYYALKNNEEEEQMYKEEEQKRQKTNTFQYSYDVPTDPSTKPHTTDVPAPEIDEDYVPSPILDVPVDIDIPKTVKESARIEKTAMFVCKQGPQMEILIKAKQAGNPQFSFLNQGDKLYKFYRHVLAALKAGRYQGHEPKIESKNELKQDDGNDQAPSSHYLHPSLLSTSLQREPVPQVPYKPSANCAYSQLVSRIQGTPAEPTPEPETAQTFAQMTYEQQQYYQYYYAQQYYEYYKQVALFQQGQGGNPGQFVPPPDFQNLDPNIQSYIQQIAYTQYLQQHQQQQTGNSPYAQIVSNVIKDVNPYTVNMPQLPQYSGPTEGVTATKPTGTGLQLDDTASRDSAIDKVEVVMNKSLVPLAAYGSSSESDSDDSSAEEEKKKVPEFAVPTGETQSVIDKMAIYVSKNGEKFEDIVRAKGDPRFEFLKKDNEYNRYYREKIKKLKEEDKEKRAVEEKAPIVDKKEQVVEKKEPEKKEVKTPKKEKKVIAEDKIKDKLMAAAREKLALATKDRALQLERKRRAAAFLKLKSVEHQQNNEASVERSRSKTPLSRSGSVEIIESPIEEEPKKARSKRKREQKERVKLDERERSKEKRSRTPKKDDDEVIEKRKKEDKREKKKKSHKRKHSKSHRESRSRKKSKKRHRRSDSSESNSSNAS